MTAPGPDDPRRFWRGLAVALAASAPMWWGLVELAHRVAG